MPKIKPIVEGPGDVAALPIIIEKILKAYPQHRGWQILKPIMTQGCGNMLRVPGIERFVQRAQKEQGCSAVLVVIDGDAIHELPENQRLQDDCSPSLANLLARRIRAIRPSVPVAVVVAKWEFEAWFLASLETIAGRRTGGLAGLPETARFVGDVEQCLSPKDWINARLPHKHRYSETRDQVKLAKLLDINLVAPRSRSFQRLQHAVQEVVDFVTGNPVIVTPDYRRE